MKLLDAAGKTLKNAAAAVVKAVSPTKPARHGDPWYSDDERKAEMSRGERWLGPRRGGWLR